MPVRSGRYSVEGIVSAAFLVGLLLLILFQIASRLGFMPGQVWTEELIRWIWVWMALVGVSEAERQQQHLRMEMLPALWSAAVRRAVYTAIDAATGALAVYLAWLGVKGVLRTWNDESVTLHMSDAVLYAALPVGAALWALRLFLRVAGRHQPAAANTA
jgi:TRAP-type C4-dicarboxylate transport system permease small subunit